MTDWTVLERFLDTDPADVACGQAIDILHVYADLLATGADTAARCPGVAARLGRMRSLRRGLPRTQPRAAMAPLTGCSAVRPAWRAQLIGHEHDERHNDE